MRTVLWDMDGTIADTEELHFLAWQETMSAYGIDYTYESFLGDFGRNNSEILSRIFAVEPGHAKVREVATRKEKAFRDLLPHHRVPLLPGVEELLATLERHGVRQVVSSSGTMANIAGVITQLGIGDRFMGLMSGYRLPRGKPHPALFLNSAAAVGVTPGDCLVIEDSLVGIEAARRAGMASVAVGKITSNPALAALLDELHGRPCLTKDSLANLTWDELESLWAAPHSTDTGADEN
ncbi:MAG: HAD family hydrolase [Caldilineaceae bacterium]